MQEMLETWVQPLGQEDPLEKEMATHSSILAWRILWTEEPGGLPSVGSHRVGPDWSDLAAAASIFVWRIPWTEEPHGLQYGSQRDTTEQLTHISLSSVQSLSHVQLFPTPWTAASQASLSITNSWRLLKFMSIELVMPSNHLILCHPRLLPSIFPSIRIFSNESVVWNSSRDSQESSSTPQFKSINFGGLRLLYGPTLASIHDYWKDHSLDYMDLCWQSDIFAF